MRIGVGPHKGQKRALDLPELELQAVGAGNCWVREEQQAFTAGPSLQPLS